MTASAGSAAATKPAAPSEKTSVAIENLAKASADGEVTLGGLVAALKDRGFGVFMVLFALPNAVIPGLSFILGIPVLLFGLQLAAGRDEVWLPGFLRRRKLPSGHFQKIAAQTVKFLIWAERRVRQRWIWLVSGRAGRFLGLYIAILATFLMMPVPFGNALPALGISFISAGLIEKDGKVAAAGILLGFLGVIYIVLTVALGFEAVKALL